MNFGRTYLHDLFIRNANKFETSEIEVSKITEKLSENGYVSRTSGKGSEKLFLIRSE
ncbi:MAG: hypothetical protein JRN20_04535 [Nitrososphaerota archaeon]|nr:hypothetical protein [Nitrososphaerota archaeon]MDG6924136.1 hypothetical protein [Nitrososphaerota archaeon]